MFKFFKSTDKIVSPCEGDLKRLDQVNDEVFSSKMMGDGFAIKPIDGNIFSPIEATVVSIFPTKHAISLKSSSGLECLVHIGIDTVDLKGEGFSISVSEGDKIKRGTLLGTVDLEYLKTNGKATDIMVVFTNLDSNKVKKVSNKRVSYGEEIFSL